MGMKDVYIYESFRDDEVDIYALHRVNTLIPHYILIEVNFQNIATSSLEL